jgi:hypothetical protein
VEPCGSRDIFASGPKRQTAAVPENPFQVLVLKV